MHLLYTDETNIDPKTTDFFVYAGVVIPPSTAGSLSAAIDALRRAHGYKPNDLLKFNTIERPKYVTSETHTQLKQQVMAEAARQGVKLLASVILHRIAISPEEARRREINRISLHFDYYLHREQGVGLVLIDTFKDTILNRLLQERFSTGLVGMPYGPYRLKKILGFHISSIGTSNFCSVVDIVLGSLRYAINARSDLAKLPTARILLQQIAPFTIRCADGRVSELSFFFSPRTIKADAYLQEYQNLHAFLAQNGLECEQQPGH